MMDFKVVRIGWHWGVRTEFFGDDDKITNVGYAKDRWGNVWVSLFRKRAERKWQELVDDYA